MKVPQGCEEFRRDPSFYEVGQKPTRAFYNKSSVSTYAGLSILIDQSTALPARVVLWSPSGTKDFLVSSGDDIVNNLSDWIPSTGVQIGTDSQDNLDIIAKMFLRDVPRASWSTTWMSLYNGDVIHVGKYRMKYLVRKKTGGRLLIISGFKGNANLEIISLHEWEPDKLMKALGIPLGIRSPQERSKAIATLMYHIPAKLGLKTLPRHMYNVYLLFEMRNSVHLMLENLQGDVDEFTNFLAYQCCNHTHWKEHICSGMYDVMDVDGNMWYFWAVSQVVSLKDIRYWCDVSGLADFTYRLEHGPFKSTSSRNHNMKPAMGFFLADIEVLHTTWITSLPFNGMHGTGRRPRWATLQEILYCMNNPRKYKVHNIISGRMGYSNAPPPGRAHAKYIWDRRASERTNPVVQKCYKLGAAISTGLLFQKRSQLVDVLSTGERSQEWSMGRYCSYPVYATAMAIARCRLEEWADHLGVKNLLTVDVDGFKLDPKMVTQEQMEHIRSTEDELGGLRVNFTDCKGVLVNTDLQQYHTPKGLLKVGNQDIQLEEYLRENPDEDTIETFHNGYTPLSVSFDHYDSLKEVGYPLLTPKVYPLGYLNYTRGSTRGLKTNIDLINKRFQFPPLNLAIAGILEEGEMDIPFDTELTLPEED